jgi:hypothetical protein
MEANTDLVAKQDARFAELVAKISSGQPLTDTEQKEFQSYARSKGALPKGAAAPKGPSNQLLRDLSKHDEDLYNDLQDVMSRILEATKPGKDGDVFLVPDKTYALIAFDRRGYGNARAVDIWRADGEKYKVEKPDKNGNDVYRNKTERRDDWYGPAGFPSCDLQTGDPSLVGDNA